MLEIVLERATAPDQMKERPCGMCGVEFRPKAVLIAVRIDGQYIDEAILCEPCLEHLGRRATALRTGPDWDFDHAAYLAAAEKYPEPYFPTMEALLEYEEQHDGYVDYRELQVV